MHYRQWVALIECDLSINETSTLELVSASLTTGMRDMACCKRKTLIVKKERKGGSTALGSDICFLCLS